jgi:hypothetical protein
MSLQTCQAGDTQGYPLQLSQSLYSSWLGIENVDNELKKIIVPSDITVSWAPIQQSASIRASVSDGAFIVSGFSIAASSTTLSLGNAAYMCSEILSITKSQHPHFSKETGSLYEITLAFQILNPTENPSSPEFILLTRPIIFTESNWDSNPLWNAIDRAALYKSSESVNFDLKSLFAYESGSLLPAISYQTCLPVKLRNYRSGSPIGSVRFRVCVAMSPLYVNANTNGLGLCRNISKYTLITQPKQVIDIFPGISNSTRFQFQDGYGPDRFPANDTNNYVPLEPGSRISSFSEILDKCQIIVPKEFIERSISDLSSKTPPVPVSKGKKQYTCYRIDPSKDIKENQIIVDPQTGKPLSSTLKDSGLSETGANLNLDGSNIDTSSVDASGIKPGDVQFMIFILLTCLGSFILLSYFAFVVYTFMIKKDLGNGLLHTGGFITALISLILFGIFFGSK